MNYSLTLIFSLLFFTTSFASCDQVATVSGSSDAGKEDNSNTPNLTGSKMRIKIGTHTFLATLDDNAAATAFKTLLPLTLAMNELNGNEKYFDFSTSLPTNASNPGTIQIGDLMLYGSKTLVLFYKSFPTPYSYTRLGRITDPAGLAAALGSGNVTVTFELE
ncbi:cyclophilin-like fold protein [Telluribacter sp. SYSU D00476]|uniref:cyclophilin-like fold protein n=1 Tax=Telluribacter sp. SYSU D00476 TaxID=2811430 RepID=UPI001FF64FC3|nr:cyclophilin-like fold protein [Telluribacter sp. SYSU D00476]